ncbi:hypothetical protein ASF10_14075 [Flavobacterium sp. Leaf82]|uniref:hypothetical protein n=1 Tax=Flavobacterium sp. Leaf82 TaxID=1736238 RepID=UPI0006F7F856|nr:hypothetical protein [Flavobacterium sp. Leaf82]KQO21243.1 hypothetical protein ASF10_14075 [Flavobacterium sp. Leaf82]
MNCIICDNTADEVGSHLIPASLIKNCVGKHYSEESFNINSKASKIDTYFGRDNLKNQSAEIKQNHYKRDYILCKICEKKLAELESKFASEFLQKFREDKYLANFNSYKSSSDLEILEPKKILNVEIQAYFYSIILRFCYIYKFEGGDSYIEESDLLKIKKFLYNYLFANSINKEYEIENFKIAIIFNKYSTNSAFISTSDKLKNPYIFYFCEAILILYIEENKNDNKSLFVDCLNSITDKTSKIIVGPKLMYEKFTSLISYIIAEDFMTNGINYISELNKKSFKENEIEVKELIEKYEKDEKGLYIMKIFEELKTKYSI